MCQEQKNSDVAVPAVPEALIDSETGAAGGTNFALYDDMAKEEDLTQIKNLGM